MNVLLNNMLDSLHKNNYVCFIRLVNVDLSHDGETSAAMEEFKNIFCSHPLYIEVRVQFIYIDK